MKMTICTVWVSCEVAPKLADCVKFDFASGDFPPTSDDVQSTYSPSILENNVPTRSKSQMSNPIVPFYVYENIKKVTETAGSRMKSKSNEDLHAAFERDNVAYKSSKVGKPISDYKVKIAKENMLRERMIKELLLENESISKKLMKSSGKFKKNSLAKLFLFVFYCSLQQNVEI